MMFSYPGGKPVDILDKNELIVGQEYRGRCRNAEKAVWNGKGFEYTRCKFSDCWLETIPHPSDFQGFDVFLPIRSLNEGL